MEVDAINLLHNFLLWLGYCVENLQLAPCCLSKNDSVLHDGVSASIATYMYCIICHYYLCQQNGSGYKWSGISVSTAYLQKFDVLNKNYV